MPSPLLEPHLLLAAHSSRVWAHVSALWDVKVLSEPGFPQRSSALRPTLQSPHCIPQLLPTALGNLTDAFPGPGRGGHPFGSREDESGPSLASSSHLTPLLWAPHHVLSVCACVCTCVHYSTHGMCSGFSYMQHGCE